MRFFCKSLGVTQCKRLPDVVRNKEREKEERKKERREGENKEILKKRTPKRGRYKRE
jgi:hypothetical protein